MRVRFDELFYRGRYQDVLAATVDAPSGAVDKDAVPFVVGALTFRGRLTEAQHLFAVRNTAAMSLVERVMSQFFLGVGYCRRSDYARARELFGANLRLGSRHELPSARFYAWQGLGFYRLFCGRYRQGYQAAENALKAALEAGCLYSKTIAADLMAHNQILPGHVSKALHTFAEAARFAEKLGDGGISQAIRVSQLIHSAQFGLDPANDLARLVECLRDFHEEDNYSRSRLLLEIARQHTLRGDKRAAREALGTAVRLIYASNNRRYGIVLNLRFAALEYVSGEPHQALNLVRNAARDLDPVVDRSLEFEVSGFEQKLAATAGVDLGSSETAARYARLVQDQNRSGKAINQRILARHGAVAPPVEHLGDDPLGDLIDLCVRDPAEATERLVAAGYLGLLHKVVPGSVGKRMIVFDLVPGAVTVFDRGQVSHNANGATAVLRSLARHLSQGEVAKDELIRRVWGYDYHPLKHDPLIYRSVSRFRGLLDAAGEWLQATEAGYRMRPDVEVRFMNDVTEAQDGAGRGQVTSSEPRTGRASTPAAASAGERDESAVTDVLNHRQRKILAMIAAQGEMDVAQCCAAFGVSKITARRDLSEMAARGFLRRLGRGRLTRYGAVTSRATVAVPGPVS